MMPLPQTAEWGSATATHGSITVRNTKLVYTSRSAQMSWRAKTLKRTVLYANIYDNHLLHLILWHLTTIKIYKDYMVIYFVREISWNCILPRFDPMFLLSQCFSSIMVSTLLFWRDLSERSLDDISQLKGEPRPRVLSISWSPHLVEPSVSLFLYPLVN